MTFAIIDTDLTNQIQFRLADQGEVKKAKSLTRPDIVYRVRVEGGTLSGVNREGLDRILGALRWLSERKRMLILDNIGILLAAVKDNCRIHALMQGGDLQFYTALTKDGNVVPKRSPHPSIVTTWLSDELALPGVEAAPTNVEDWNP